MSEPTTIQMCWRLLRNDPVTYALAWIQWVTFFLSPVMVGLLLKVVLDRLTVDGAAVPWGLLGLVLAIEIARWLLLVNAAVQWHGAWVGWQTVPRVNLLTSLATGDGPITGRLPGSPGEAVSRFRDDVQDVALVLDVWLDISGAVIAAGVAIAIMASIAPFAAVAVLVPVALAAAISIGFGPKLREWRRLAREATGAVTGFIGDTFGAILAVKTAGAESAVDDRFAELNRARAEVSLRDNVGSELVRSLGYGTGEITVGIVLLVVASSLRAGDLSVGDIALFAGYVTVIAGLAKWVGRLTTYHRQADVSTGRLAELSRGASRASVVAPTTTHLRHGPPPLDSSAPAVDPLVEMTVRGLTVRHPGSGRGITDIDLRIEAGDLLVVTGPVGSGKTTLLRAVLGLVDADAGTVTWNGVEVDPATALVPPRVSYLPQVPRLFSESIAETVLLGRSDDELQHALWLACLDEDLARMEHGAATVVGPRGVRLSGGQIQRTGAARAFVRRPQLLVVDDLSSALDVETELELWRRLRAERPPAALIVSHRNEVLDMADQVLELDHGRVVSTR